MDLTEDRLIEAIARVVGRAEPDVLVGIGDDAAVVEPGTGRIVLTTDLLVEGVHFERGSISARDLGAKAVIASLSDVAAMAASPRYALVSLAVPEDVDAGWVVELYGGMRDACVEHALVLVGGDTSSADMIVVSVSVIGEVAPGRELTRSGARAGDRIVITGSLGAAAGGLALSRLEPSRAATALSQPWGRELAEAFARPVARVGEARVLARAGATAMMDLSDGLARDLGRLCRASAVGARVHIADLPVASALVEGAELLGVDPTRLAVAGGEDYELLATLPVEGVERAGAEMSETFSVAVTEVGEIVEASGMVEVGADGTESPLEPEGWDHFRG